MRAPQLHVVRGAPPRWIVRAPRQTPPSFRLLCLPYAGGSAAVFRAWQASLPDWVEVCALELPGRGTRMLERPATRMVPLVDAAARAVRPDLDVPYAIFGHSMGGMLGFELARWLRRAGAPMPCHLFVAGAAAPHVTCSRRPVHTLPDDAFIERLRSFNGTPPEVLDNRELMELLLPAVRADFTLFETHVFAREPPLACPITAIGGSTDSIVHRDALAHWAEQTTGPFALHLLPGGHFFLNTDPPRLLTLLATELVRLRPAETDRCSTRGSTG